MNVTKRSATENHKITRRRQEQGTCYRPIQATNNKESQLTAYKAQSYSDGYESDLTANTQNLEATFAFQADTTEFNANIGVNSNGEIEGTSDLTVNATASKSILGK